MSTIFLYNFTTVLWRKYIHSLPHGRWSQGWLSSLPKASQQWISVQVETNLLTLQLFWNTSSSGASYSRPTPLSLDSSYSELYSSPQTDHMIIHVRVVNTLLSLCSFFPLVSPHWFISLPLDVQGSYQPLGSRLSALRAALQIPCTSPSQLHAGHSPLLDWAVQEGRLSPVLKDSMVVIRTQVQRWEHLMCECT